MSSGVIYPAQPEKILKELSKVWTSLGKEEKQQGKPTVLRACAMTLIVATDDEDEGHFSAAQTLAELMHEHPSRGIVLRVSEKSEQGLEARVLALCWKPFGKAQQICCEQIEIVANPQNWPFVGPTITGIIAPDLPVVLWCRQQTALISSATDPQKAGLDVVMRFARKVIIDTLGADLKQALPIVKSWREQGHVVADLEWTRLTPWREALANSFDDLETQRASFKYHQVQIAHTEEKPSAAVLYMGGWLASALKAEVSFVQKANEFGSGLHRVSLRSQSDCIELTRTSKESMTLTCGGRNRQYSFSELTLYKLMNEELAVLGPDQVFDSAFSRALELSQA